MGEGLGALRGSTAGSGLRGAGAGGEAAPHLCVPVSLHLLIPVSLYPHIPVSLYSCIPTSLHPCISASLDPYIPASPHSHIPLSLYPCIPSSLYLCIPGYSHPHIPTSLHPLIPTSLHPLIPTSPHPFIPTPHIACTPSLCAQSQRSVMGLEEFGKGAIGDSGWESIPGIPWKHPWAAGSSSVVQGWNCAQFIPSGAVLAAAGIQGLIRSIQRLNQALRESLG